MYIRLKDIGVQCTEQQDCFNNIHYELLLVNFYCLLLFWFWNCKCSLKEQNNINVGLPLFAVREHVQISASSHANANQLHGCWFFLIPFSIGTGNIGPEWNRISNGSNFLIRPINRGHQILPYICHHLSKGWNRQSCCVTDKNHIGSCLCQWKQRVNNYVFNAQTG